MNLKKDFLYLCFARTKHFLKEKFIREQKGLGKYKYAIDHALTVRWLGTIEAFPNPREALEKIIEWEVSQAVNPKVNGGKVLVDEAGYKHLKMQVWRLKKTSTELLRELVQKEATQTAEKPAE